ncbi:MAG: ferritin family protein, partial [Bacteroidales bacterium]
MKKRFVIVAVMIIATAFVSCKQKEAPKEEAPCEVKKVITIEHLQKAIKGETDASVKYATISTEAAKKKMPNTANMFAAASAAEAVHIANHQNALKQLGETYEYTAEAPVLNAD